MTRIYVICANAIHEEVCTNVRAISAFVLVICIVNEKEPKTGISAIGSMA